ncbi:MAG TPA: formate/nitrite transporter family protein [Candidatus Baltobacteraceae bacterium]|nr:formate/nitrite transporter family protein [Candidatus Baltobacteraceae bacterium]
MNPEQLTDEETEEAERRARPRSAVIYETIRKEGSVELERAPASLFWSALASGLSMVFSLVTMGVLRAALPDTKWAQMVTALGYSMGFLIVILGRQQLFTENTLTPLLPLFSDRKVWVLRRVARLWLVVFVGNLAGTAIASAWVAFSGAFTPEQQHAFAQIAKDAVAPSTVHVFTKAIFAGWVIALMVWLLPLTEVFAPVIVIILTWLISAAKLEHVIAGSADTLYGLWTGAIGWGDFAHFLLPTLFGNIVGGVAFVAAVATAEIATEHGGPKQKKERVRAARGG